MCVCVCVCFFVSLFVWEWEGGWFRLAVDRVKFFGWRGRDVEYLRSISISIFLDLLNSKQLRGQEPAPRNLQVSWLLDIAVCLLWLLVYGNQAG